MDGGIKSSAQPADSGSFRKRPIKTRLCVCVCWCGL